MSCIYFADGCNTTCENEGYVNKNCKCTCPEHIRGSRCESIATGKYIVHAWWETQCYVSRIF